MIGSEIGAAYLLSVTGRAAEFLINDTTARGLAGLRLGKGRAFIWIEIRRQVAVLRIGAKHQRGKGQRERGKNTEKEERRILHEGCASSEPGARKRASAGSSAGVDTSRAKLMANA